MSSGDSDGGDFDATPASGPSDDPTAENAPNAESEPKPADPPVTVGRYGWEDFKREYYYDENGDAPEEETFDPAEYLGFSPEELGPRLSEGDAAVDVLADIFEERTVRVDPDIDEDEFFSNDDGTTTVVTRYDLERAVPQEKKSHFREVDRYWVNKPYAFVIIFHSEKENEKKYYLVQPHLTELEADIREFLVGKLKTAIKYSDDGVIMQDGEDARSRVIETETHNLLDRYDLYAEGARPGDDEGLSDTIRGIFGIETAEKKTEKEDEEPIDDTGGRIGSLRDRLGLVSEDETSGEGFIESIRGRLGIDSGDEPSDDGGFVESIRDRLGIESADGTAGDGGVIESLQDRLGIEEIIGTTDEDESNELQGISARPEPDVLAEGSRTLTEHQIEKLLYLLKRDFIGFERIDGIKYDINVEDISCDGYNSPVFVYHSEYEQIITNIYHGEEELDEFVVKLAQRSGKGISKRSPQVDATLPDGSRAQLTLGREVSDHGTNYTIRQFKDVPHTPIDLINWNTFSLEEMAFLWLSIENQKSLVFAGGTASGKTTSLNAVSLFIPSKAKIVSIEDTREVELPQRNWIASVTRPSFSDGDKGDVDEFDLLEAALRQRPEYIVMGEIRGEEGRTLFQVMSTGHTTLTTFHADSVGEVIKRFTTEPINVSKTMFTALDLISVQTQTRIEDEKLRRNKSLTEINHYDPENDEINVQDVYQWQAQSDTFLQMGDSNTLDSIAFDRGWSHERLDREITIRELILAYLIHEGLNTYTQVAATLQAFINDPDTILSLIATGNLEQSLEDLREMESVEIDIDPEKEAMVPRPGASDEMLEHTQAILDEAEPLLEEYRDGEVAEDVAEALEIGSADDIDLIGPQPEGETTRETADPGIDIGPGGETRDDTATPDGGPEIPDIDEFEQDSEPDIPDIDEFDQTDESDSPDFGPFDSPDDEES
jgi:flagellar protein FlaI